MKIPEIETHPVLTDSNTEFQVSIACDSDDPKQHNFQVEAHKGASKIELLKACVYINKENGGKGNRIKLPMRGNWIVKIFWDDVSVPVVGAVEIDGKSVHVDWSVCPKRRNSFWGGFLL